MATGVPVKRQVAGHPKALLSSDGANSSLRLEYPGKRSEREILAVAPTEFDVLFRGSGQHPPRAANRLYFGDNLGVLAALLRDGAVAGKAKLVYIDPPFATRSSFHSRKLQHAYEDTLCGPEFVEFLRARLVLLRELLAHDGSIYLHLDERMVFHLKIVMDEVFGQENFRNCITRKKCNPKNYTRRKFGNVSDYILWYSKSDAYVWNRPLEAWTAERADKEYQYVEPTTGRRYKKVPLHAPGVRNGETGKPWRGMMPPPGKHWQFSPSKLDEFDARGEIYWSPSGNPRRKIYLDESQGIGIQDIWLEFRDAHNQNIHITGYPTEKNPDLLKRIIEASSNPGDLVLDCFCGSGTTLAVASALGRKWIGVDNSQEAIGTTLRRLAGGTAPMGDFVSLRKAAEETGSARRQGEATLFDSLGVGNESACVERNHCPVVDFDLLADKTVSQHIAGLVRLWKTESRSLLRACASDIRR